jgi:hydrogenase expression/formation protein HypE
MDEYVLLDHGSGGTKTAELIERVFRSRFSNEALDAETDAALLDYPADAGRLAVTTDAHAVKPLFFPGGDIGTLAVAGTVNDLAVCGARPRHLTASFVIEEGFPLADLERIAESMARTARSAGVEIVAGDTKVAERGDCDGVFITTTGIGAVPSRYLGIADGSLVREGDVIALNGPIAEHGAAVVCARHELETEEAIRSDCAPLGAMIASVLEESGGVHFIRDATRGGVATVLCELAERRGLDIAIREESIPLRPGVGALCEMFGFDPLYLANEGNAVMVLEPHAAERALQVMRQFPEGRDAAVIGEVRGTAEGRADAAKRGRSEGDRVARQGSGRVVLETGIGGDRILRRHAGAQLPRIC